MLNTPKAEPVPGAGYDPFIGSPDTLVASPWQESQTAPEDEPHRTSERVIIARQPDQNDYPEYYLG